MKCKFGISKQFMYFWKVTKLPRDIPLSCIQAKHCRLMCFLRLHTRPEKTRHFTNKTSGFEILHAVVKFTYYQRCINFTKIFAELQMNFSKLPDIAIKNASSCERNCKIFQTCKISRIFLQNLADFIKKSLY